MYPVAIPKVVATLGGTPTLGTTVETLRDLTDAVARGLPREVVPAIVASAAGPGAAARGRIAGLMVAPATFKRSPRLSPAASERAERLARTVALAAEALGDSEAVRDWLNAPHPMLGGRVPIELAATELGARQVERILLNVLHDLPA